MNDHEAENELRDYYTSITPTATAHVSSLVSNSLRARRDSRARTNLTTKTRVFASLAAAMAVVLIVGISFGAWRRGPSNGFPPVASGSPSARLLNESPTPSPTAAPTDTPTPRPTPTLKAPTKSTPSHSFSLTGSMHGHFDTATLLEDGRVLMTGDSTIVNNQDVYTTLAELYDPGTGVFTPTGSLLHALEGATATRLQDGRVLIAGGIVTDALDSPDASSAEIYDPATGKFTATGSLVQQRNDHTATLLGNGEVLIAGGWNAGGGHTLATAELYDPKSGTFRPTSPLASTRMRATATSLADGRAMIFGGLGSDFKMPTTVEIYDPRTGAFSPAGSIPEWGQGWIVTRLTDGDVLTEGGTSGGGATAYELYDPATGSFRPAGSPTINRGDGPAVLLANGQVLIAGGAYSPHEGDVEPGRQVSTVAFASSGGRERYYHLPAPTPAEGLGVIAFVPPVTIFATAELYDPTTGKFTRTGSMSHPRDGATATLLLDGRVLIAGGRTGTGLTTDLTAELYQP